MKLAIFSSLVAQGSVISTDLSTSNDPPQPYATSTSSYSQECHTKNSQHHMRLVPQVASRILNRFYAKRHFFPLPRPFHMKGVMGVSIQRSFYPLYPFPNPLTRRKLSHQPDNWPYCFPSSQSVCLHLSPISHSLLCLSSFASSPHLQNVPPPSTLHPSDHT